MNRLAYRSFCMWIWLLLSCVMLLTTSAYGKNCFPFLALDFDDQENLNSLSPYAELEPQLKIFVQENSPRKVVTLFKTFKKEYHQRYESYLEDILQRFPNAETTPLHILMSGFKALESQHFEMFLSSLQQISSKKRIHYLKSLDNVQLSETILLLDTFLGITSEDAVEDQSKDSDWSYLFDAVEAMNIKSDETVADFNSNSGRLGMIIGLLHPKAKFIGFQSNEEDTKRLNQIAFQNGFTNVKFQTADIPISNSSLPAVDHWGLFTLHEAQVVKLLSEMFTKISQEQSFRIYSAHPFNDFSHFDDYHISNINYVTIYNP